MNIRQHKQLDGSKFSFAIIHTSWNYSIVDKLVQGAKDALIDSKVPASNIFTIECSGALEIPLTAKTLAMSDKFDVIIALACIIRGETYHFDIVANNSAQGLLDISLENNIPCLNGILTVENEEQAIARSANKMNNKGYECAIASIELLLNLNTINNYKI